MKKQTKQNNKAKIETQKIYNHIYDTNETFNENFCYRIIMNKEEDLEILTHTSKIKFPRIQQLAIYNPPIKPTANLRKLMKNSFPENLTQFYISWSNNPTLMSSYIDSLLLVIPKTLSKVYFAYPRMDYDDFSKILKASHNCNTLIFMGLTLTNSGSLDFGTKIDYNIRYF